MAGVFYYPIGAQVVHDLHSAAKKFRQQIEPRMADEDVPWDWIYADRLASVAIPDQAPLHDILVVGAHNPTGSTNSPSKLVGDLVLQVRSPVLVVPSSAKGLPLDGPAVVAWNGSPEGAHALRSAMPILTRASAVHILTVREENDLERFDLPPTDAAKYLAGYDIEAEIVELPVDGKSAIADTLNAAAQSRNATCLVMGAYGHSRFRERILGGVTRDMLSDPQVPLLLSH